MVVVCRIKKQRAVTRFYGSQNQIVNTKFTRPVEMEQKQEMLFIQSKLKSSSSDWARWQWRMSLLPSHSAFIHSAASPQTCICQPQPHQRGRGEKGEERRKGDFISPTESCGKLNYPYQLLTELGECADRNTHSRNFILMPDLESIQSGPKVMWSRTPTPECALRQDSPNLRHNNATHL